MHHPDEDHGYEWRFRWWLADTLRPHLLIILSGLIAAGLGAALYRQPAAIPLLLLAAACAYAQNRC
jgi:hypothetical protein